MPAPEAILRLPSRMEPPPPDLQSPSEKGPLRIAFPSKVVETYFPWLFTDLPAA